MGRGTSPLRPGWPALMSAELAAGYLSLDMASFGEVAAAGGLVPAELGLQLERWRRADLDCFVAQLALRRQRPGSPVERRPPEPAKPVEQAAVEPTTAPLAGLSRQAMSIKDAAATTGLGRSTLYRLMSEGRLRKVKVGGRTLVRCEDLIALLGASEIT